jgi:hypothetical protein
MAKVFQSAGALEMQGKKAVALGNEHAVKPPKSASPDRTSNFQLHYFMYFMNANVSFCLQRHLSVVWLFAG